MHNPSIQLQLHHYQQSIGWYQDGHNSKIFNTTEILKADFCKTLWFLSLSFQYNNTNTDKVLGDIKIAITGIYFIQLR